ncbi:MAG: hypothetical protein FJ357_06930 [Thaumarchaeota archaeon]|nr:hypothetical protein [Nitrososphaerota archaeon]
MSAKLGQAKIRSSVMSILDEGITEKTKIYKKLQSEFGISQSEARLACKQVKIDLMLKLKALQSGVVEF